MYIVKDVGLALNRVQTCIYQAKRPDNLARERNQQDEVLFEIHQLAIVYSVAAAQEFNRGRDQKDSCVESGAPGIFCECRLDGHKIC
jgi:hypothetical protein